MLTIFTVPKPFRGNIAIIQRNAIQSWLRLHPDCEVILLGDEDGTRDAAIEFRIRHVRELKRNEYGTPLVSSAFEIAQEIACHQLVCYVNADIILLSDLAKEIQKLDKHVGKFLLVGRRWNIDFNETCDFDRPDWESVLKSYVAKFGTLFTQRGIDYFVFRRGQYWDMPPFAVGRPAWDNWMIYRARLLHIPVIDATAVVTAIHQNHGYQHVPNSINGTFNGPEGKKNVELAGGPSHAFAIEDANRILTSKGLGRPKMTYTRLHRELETLSVLHPCLRFIAVNLKRFLYLVGLINSKIKQIFRKLTKI